MEHYGRKDDWLTDRKGGKVVSIDMPEDELF